MTRQRLKVQKLAIVILINISIHLKQGKFNSNTLQLEILLLKILDGILRIQLDASFRQFTLLYVLVIRFDGLAYDNRSYSHSHFMRIMQYSIQRMRSSHTSKSAQQKYTSNNNKVFINSCVDHKLLPSYAIIPIVRCLPGRNAFKCNSCLRV